MAPVILHREWTPIQSVPGLEYRYHGDTPDNPYYFARDTLDLTTGMLHRSTASLSFFEFRIGGYYGRVPVDSGYIFRGSNRDTFEVMDFIIDDFLAAYKYSILKDL